MKSHSGYYLWAAEQLVAQGFAVYALDLHGRGQSDGERFYLEQMADYVDDAHTLVTLAKSRHPSVPFFLLGHSAGGVISSVYTLEHQAELPGFICESFAFQVYAPDFALAVVKGLSHVAPHLHVLNLKTEDFSRDPAAVQAMNDDPLIAERSAADQHRRRAGPRRRAAEARVPADHAAGADPARHGGQGDAAAAAASSSTTRPARSDKTLKLYDGHAHDLLNDLGRERRHGRHRRVDRRAPAGRVGTRARRAPCRRCGEAMTAC